MNQLNSKKFEEFSPNWANFIPRSLLVMNKTDAQNRPYAIFKYLNSIKNSKRLAWLNHIN